MKTNAMRLLDRAGISYEVKEYQVDEQDLSGEHVADLIGAEYHTIYKTLVLTGDSSHYLVCCIPVHKELDLKKVARISKNKKVEMLPVKNLMSVTGYIRGGCSPIGMKKTFPIYIEEKAVLCQKIAVSAGVRGKQILLDPKILAEFTKAEFSSLVFS